MIMKKCDKCLNEFPDNALFCQFCGIALEKELKDSASEDEPIADFSSIKIPEDRNPISEFPSDRYGFSDDKSELTPSYAPPENEIPSESRGAHFQSKNFGHEDPQEVVSITEIEVDGADNTPRQDGLFDSEFRTPESQIIPETLHSQDHFGTSNILNTTHEERTSSDPQISSVDSGDVKTDRQQNQVVTEINFWSGFRWNYPFKKEEDVTTQFQDILERLIGIVEEANIDVLKRPLGSLSYAKGKFDAWQSDGGKGNTNIFLAPAVKACATIVKEFKDSPNFYKDNFWAANFFGEMSKILESRQRERYSHLHYCPVKIIFASNIPKITGG